MFQGLYKAKMHWKLVILKYDLNPHLFVLSYDMDKVVAQKWNRKDLVLLEAVFFKKKKKKRQVDL